MTMICSTAAAALILFYHSLFDLLEGAWSISGICAVSGLICALAAVQLCRLRDDLITG